MRRPASNPKSASLLAIVCLCLILSGSGSLMLEMVWSRMLKLVFGSTTLAISTILVAYMLGLGLGGLFGGRLTRRLSNGVRAYALFEIAIGVYSLAVPWIIDLFPAVNRALLADLSFWPAAFARFALVLVLLLVPTLLMGATLPVLVSSLVAGREELGSRVGLLYGINTLGAVTGVVVATFVLFPRIGLIWTNTLAAALDIGVGLAALLFIAPRVTPRSIASAPGVPASSRWSLGLVSYGLVGFTALVYEVCWARALSMIFGSSTYAFASMLAAFLGGIALGSLAGRRWADRSAKPFRDYSLGLAGLGLFSLFTVLLFGWLPEIYIAFVRWFGPTGAVMVYSSVAISVLAMIAPTLILGALFPLLTRAAAASEERIGITVGDVYFVNTIGSATGAFLAGFVLIPTVGIRQTIALAVGVNLVSAAVVVLWQREWRTPASRALAAGLTVAGIVLALFPPAWDQSALTRGVYHSPLEKTDYGIELLPMKGVQIEKETIFYEEGVNVTTSIHRAPSELEMRLNGKTDASFRDLSTQLLCGHLPMLFGPEVEDMLVIGYASGMTTGVASLYAPRTIDVIEIEPAVIRAASYFQEYNYDPLKNDNVRLILDDGRTYLSSTDRRYDLINSEPSNPWVAGCSNLFTKEFFGDALQALEPDGRLLQWIQLYGMDPEGVRSILAATKTRFEFVYGFLNQARGLDLLLVASNQPLTAEQFPRWEEVPPAARRDLERFGTNSTADLLSLVFLTPDDVDSIVATAEIVNTDDNMFVEFRSPWLIYAPPDDNWQFLNRYASGVMPALQGANLDPELIGEIALSYLGQRGNPALALATVRSTEADSGSLRVARAQLDAGSAPIARPVLDEIVARYPESISARRARAAVAQQQRDAETALADLNVALELQPGHLPTHRQRLQAFGALGRFAEAKADGDRLMMSAAAPFHPEWYPDAAIAAAAAGDLGAGIDRLRKYLDLQPFSSQHWSLLADLHQTAGEAGEAAHARANADLARQNSARLLHRRARRELALGGRRPAIALLEQAVQLDPTYEAARAELDVLRRKAS